MARKEEGGRMEEEKGRGQRTEDKEEEWGRYRKDRRG
jgi:hypothetical protein